MFSHGVSYVRYDRHIKLNFVEVLLLKFEVQHTNINIIPH